MMSLRRGVRKWLYPCTETARGLINPVGIMRGILFEKENGKTTLEDWNVALRTLLSMDISDALLISARNLSRAYQNRHQAD